MTTRNLDPELAPILAAIEGGGMFDDEITYPAMRERFEETAPLMWDAGKLPVHETVDHVIEGPAGALPIRIYTTGRDIGRAAGARLLPRWRLHDRQHRHRRPDAADSSRARRGASS